MKYTLLIIIITSLLFSLPLKAESKSVSQIKTVVIDAGHGGKDPGAHGRFSNEKDVVLPVALLLGSYITKNFPDVKVIYTRNTDQFIELNKRADIANKAKADLFIAIHANSITKPEVSGAETYILGLHRSEDNLNVAKMENSVITLEDNYTQKYEGFDPNSSESYIIFNFMQNKFINQSLKMAQYVQDQFRIQTKRTDRGVRQAGFLVLRNTGMPSILVELGYMTNASEEKYMNSKKGQENLASAIYRAFKEYKDETERKSVIVVNRVDTLALAFANEQKQQAILDNTSELGIIFKIQVFSTDHKLSKRSVEYKRYKNDLSYYQQDSKYRYMVGNCKTYKEAKDLKQKMLQVYPDAFIVAFDGSTKITVTQALNKIEK